MLPLQQIHQLLRSPSSIAHRSRGVRAERRGEGGAHRRDHRRVEGDGEPDAGRVHPQFVRDHLHPAQTAPRPHRACRRCCPRGPGFARPPVHRRSARPGSRTPGGAGGRAAGRTPPPSPGRGQAGRWSRRCRRASGPAIDRVRREPGAWHVQPRLPVAVAGSAGRRAGAGGPRGNAAVAGARIRARSGNLIAPRVARISRRYRCAGSPPTRGVRERRRPTARPREARRPAPGPG